MREDKLVKSSGTSVGRHVVTNASVGEIKATVSNIEESSFGLKIKISDPYEREISLFMSSFAARALRKALNLFANEDQWDTEDFK